MGANQHTSKGRTEGYRIMFTADEKRALDARAAAEGVTLADLIRRALGLAEAPSVRAGEGPRGYVGRLEDLLALPAFNEERPRRRRK